MQERFGTPYVTGTPIRGFMKTLLNAIEEKKQVAYLEEEKADQQDITLESGKSSEYQIILIGEPVIMKSLAVAIETKVPDKCEELSVRLRETERTACRRRCCCPRGRENWNRYFFGSPRI